MARGARAARVVRVLRLSRPPSEALLRALAGFGVAVEGPAAGQERGARRVLAAMARARREGGGTLTLVLGASGSGKSRLLRLLRSACERAGRGCVLVDLAGGAIPDAPSVLDAVREVVVRSHDGDADASREEREQRATRVALELLTRAGLADALVVARGPCELSEGEKARVRLALAMARARSQHREVALLLDEFASVLDRVSARGVCATLARWVKHASPRVSCVVATAHDDVAQWLAPDVIVRCTLRGAVRLERRAA